MSPIINNYKLYMYVPTREYVHAIKIYVLYAHTSKQ